jgi:hypothetical protein
MATPISIERAEEIYVKYHSSNIEQKALAVQQGISHSLVNRIVRSIGRYSDLRDMHPELHKRTKKTSANPVPGLAEEDAVSEPEIDLALEVLETFPRLSVERAVLFSKVAPGELTELLQIAARPCSRLAKYLPHFGRPAKNKKNEEATRQSVEEELTVGETASEKLLGEGK